MYQKCTHCIDHEEISFVFSIPFFVVGNLDGNRIVTILSILYQLNLFVQPLYRHVDTKNGYCTILLVVNGEEVRHKRRLMINSVDKGLSPKAFVFVKCLFEPISIQIVEILASQYLLLDGRTITTHSMGAEPPTFPRIVIVDKADATAADTRILLEHTFHDANELVWLVETVFYNRGCIDRCHINIGRDASNLFAFATHQAVADFHCTDLYKRIEKKEYQDCGDAHENEHS